MPNRIWLSRPTEQAALLNPPFLSALVAATAAEYRRLTGKPFPLALCLAALPMVLHRPLRTDLPIRATTSLPTWLDRNPDARLRLRAVISSFKPFLLQAVMTGVQGGVLRMVPPLSVEATGGAPRPSSGDTDETRWLRRASSLVGRWLAGSGNPETVLALLGVKP